MTRHVSELGGPELFIMAENGHEAACRERLRREIMAVDKVEYPATTKVLTQMNAHVNTNLGLIKVPYKTAIYTSLAAGVVSIPLVFHEHSARAFNTFFVTAAPPEIGEADTMLEIGSWAWGWMEPPLGTISFVLLCVQYAREQGANIGQRPFTEKLKIRCETIASRVD